KIIFRSVHCSYLSIIEGSFKLLISVLNNYDIPLSSFSTSNGKLMVVSIFIFIFNRTSLLYSKHAVVNPSKPYSSQFFVNYFVLKGIININDIIFYSVVMITFVFVTSTIVFLVIYGYKSRRRILRGRTYLGLKRAKVTFKFFNTSVSQAFLVRRNVPYD